MKLVFATGNKGKLSEVRKIFENTSYEILSKENFDSFPDVIEDRETFEENAIKKAKEIFEFSGIPAIADDSGLIVEQLNGAPGVYSASYAGENCTYDDNNNKLLKELSAFPEPHNAAFVCYAAYYDGDLILVVRGELKGMIISEKTGDQGFGYDPVFISDGSKNTLAQYSSEEKNKISHRGKAFESLKKLLRKMEL